MIRWKVLGRYLPMLIWKNFNQIFQELSKLSKNCDKVLDIISTALSNEKNEHFVAIVLFLIYNSYSLYLPIGNPWLKQLAIAVGVVHFLCFILLISNLILSLDEPTVFGLTISFKKNWSSVPEAPAWSIHPSLDLHRGITAHCRGRFYILGKRRLQERKYK